MSESNRPALPPEVEAELRRRSQAQASVPPGPEFILPGAGAPGAGGAYHGHAGSTHAAKDPHPFIKWLGPVGTLLVVLAAKGKYLLFAGKWVLPFLKTGGTMLATMWVYALESGWPFAAGFVLSILVHEMGHVFVAWRLGIPVSAPVFIPFVGAFILTKGVESPWKGALIGIGGPIGGALAAVFCLGMYFATGSILMLRLAGVGALLNLFNLLPFGMLDGGRITGAISPRIWLVGALVLGAAVLTGWLRNPLLIFVLLLSLPALWHGLRHGDLTPPGVEPATKQQKIVMGLSYVTLAAFLAWLMAFTHTGI